VVQRHALHWIQIHLIRSGVLFSKTVLVGPWQRCNQVNEKLQQYYGSKFQLIGVIGVDDSHRESHPWLPHLGLIQDIPDLVKQYGVNNIIITMAPDKPHEILDVMKTCREAGVDYRVTPDLFDLLSRRVSLQDVESLPTILFDETPLCGFGQIAKRSMDVLISGVTLIVTSPLMLFIALLIRLDSRGPVFYVQQRVGSDGNKFHIYKFRSMIDNAENETGPKWATTNDPRTTRIGRFLRRYNLDELPQFLNVLRGDMSLVGPRPERPYFVDKFKEEIPYYMRRHMVKSGITGWAQVNGWRGDTSVIERTQHDLYYVENWSLILDVKILWKTLTSFKNAY
ncbi:MAG: sugar transferase, partial [Candidatus Hinthialibacter sp.]